MRTSKSGRATARHITLASASLAMILGIAGCAGGGTTTPSGDVSPEDIAAGIAAAQSNIDNSASLTEFEVEPLKHAPQPGKKIAFVVCNIPTCGLGGMQEPADAIGWSVQEFTFDLSKGPEDYVRAFNDAVASNPDYIEVVAVFPEDLLSDGIKKANDAGIPIVNVGGRSTDGFAQLLGGPKFFQAAGAMIADVCLTAAGDATGTAMTVDPDTPVFTPWAEGMKAEVEKNGPGSTFQTIEVSQAKSQQDIASRVISFLQRNPDVTCIGFPSSDMLTYPALKAAGLTDDLMIVVGQPLQKDMAALMAGEINVAVSGRSGHTWTAVDAFLRLDEGDTIETEVVYPLRVVSPDEATETSDNPPNYQDAYKTAWQVG